jgi:hypothetical protein
LFSLEKSANQPEISGQPVYVFDAWIVIRTVWLGEHHCTELSG